MRCPICDEDVLATERAEQWGPEWAHSTCVTAYNYGRSNAIALQAEQAEPTERCPYCDDTGDVHSIDGQWRGTCNCPAARPSEPPKAPVEPVGEPATGYSFQDIADALSALRGVEQQPVAWHNPVATAMRDSMTGQVQLEYIGHFPADELVRLYAAPQPHHIDLVNVAVAVRDACHRAWVTSAENWLADVDVPQIVRDTATTPPAPVGGPPKRLSDEEITRWWFSENGLEDMIMCKRDDFRAVVRAIESEVLRRAGGGI